MQSSEIIALLKKGNDVLVNDKVIYGDLNFADVEKYQVVAFPNIETHIPVNIMFSNCVFMGKVSSNKVVNKGKKSKVNVSTVFQKNLIFFDCDFRADFSMDDMIVEGKMEFSNSVFRENTSFNSLYAKGSRVGFLDVTCEKDFSMCYAHFLNDANFMGAKFAGRVNFLGMNSIGLQFSNAEFEKDVDFSNSKFLGDIHFNYVKCASDIQFSFSKYYGDFDFLSSTCLGKTSFERSFFYGRVRLNKSAFDKLELVDAQWLRVPETEEAKLPSDASKWNVVKVESVDLK